MMIEQYLNVEKLKIIQSARASIECLNKAFSQKPRDWWAQKNQEFISESRCLVFGRGRTRSGASWQCHCRSGCDPCCLMIGGQEGD